MLNIIDFYKFLNDIQESEYVEYIQATGKKVVLAHLTNEEGRYSPEESEVIYLICNRSGMYVYALILVIFSSNLSINNGHQFLSSFLKIYIFKSSKDDPQMNNKYQVKLSHICLIGKPRTQSSDPPLRRTKSQGSAKINKSCTSQIKAKINKAKNTVNVQYWKTHYGHDYDLQHIRLSKMEKANIAHKLSTGVSMAR